MENVKVSAGNELAKQKAYLKSLRESEKEKNLLLTLSNEIASIKDKKELLYIVRSKFKKHGLYTDLAISLINEDNKTTTGYLIDWEKRRHQHPRYAKESTARHSLEDGIFNTTLDSKTPMTFNLQEIVLWEKVPSYIQFLFDRGIRDMIAVALRDQNKSIGILYLLSERKKTFTPRQMSILLGMSQQIGTAIANIRAQEVIKQEQLEKDFLLTFSYDIARIRDKNELLSLINNKLKTICTFDSSSIFILDNNKDIVTIFLQDPDSAFAQDEQSITPFLDGSFHKDELIDKVLYSDAPIVFDIDQEVSKPNAPAYVQSTHNLKIVEILSVALRNELGYFGILNLVSKTRNRFNENLLRIIQAVSNQISIAVANIIANDALVERERDKTFLLSVSRDITSCQTRADILAIVKNKLAELVHCDVILLCLNNADKITHSNYLHTIPDHIENHPDFMKMATMKYYIDDGFYNIIQDAEYPVVFDVDEMVSRSNKPFYFDFWHANNIREMVGISIRVNNQSIGAVVLHSELKNSFRLSELKLAQAVCSHIGIALSNIMAYEKIQSQLEEINRYKRQLEEENFYLQEHIKTVYNYSELVGSGAALEHVFHLVSQVAESESTVLILGETGTGKELIARAIHHASRRSARLMVKVNCAALPSQLIESELFGHEKGSFTGASDRRIGKFELANNGTLFLDEIGELALDLQAKLLRAIQEKEIERIGGKEVIKINARIIVATNRDLQSEVAAERFRSDLFYRINVFPIIIPPLRDRKEDIPALVSHFINSLSRKLGKNVTGISQKALNEMILYHWPGNVRELEHLIERSILLTTGSTIKEISLPKTNKAEPLSSSQNGSFKSLEQNERDYILATLKSTNGRVRGAGGAAEILQLPPTTLHSKMKKLGIRKTIG